MQGKHDCCPGGLTFLHPAKTDELSSPLMKIVLIDPFSTCAQLGHSLLEELERDDTSNTASTGKLRAGVVRGNE